MPARWPWRPGVAVVSLGIRPYEVTPVPGLRPMLLLRDAGFDVHMLVRDGYEERADVDGFPLWVESDVPRSARRLAALRPQLQLIESNAYGVALAPLAQRSWIRNPAPANHPRVRQLQQAVLRTADVVSFTNDADRAQWRVRDGRYVDLAYPVDVEWWSESVPRRKSWWTDRGWSVPDGPVIVSNAAYVKGKRVCELLEMLVPFLSDHPASRLVFVGHPYADPETAERLRRLPQELGVADQALVTEWITRDEIRELLAWADVSVINSLRETQCMAIYESLAAGVPMLISAVPTLTSQFPTLPAHTGQRDLLASLERVLTDQAWARSLIDSTRDRLAWADTRRHDEVFRGTLEALGLIGRA
jgi:glycosyltransferase involved in cell wall biosynthesis